MKPENLISLLAFVFSIISLAITIYHQYLKKPRIRIGLGDKIDMFLSSNGHLVITLNVALFNDGAQYGAVYKLAGNIIAHPSLNKITEFNWNMFVESRNVGVPGKVLEAFDDFAGWAETIVIPARAAVAKKIKFITVNTFTLIEGNYIIELLGFEGQNPQPSSRAQAFFTVSQRDVQKLEETKAEKGGSVSRGQLGLPLQLIRTKT